MNVDAKDVAESKNVVAAQKYCKTQTLSDRYKKKHPERKYEAWGPQQLISLHVHLITKYILGGNNYFVNMKTKVVNIKKITKNHGKKKKRKK